jgi:hypothetical protein
MAPKIKDGSYQFSFLNIMLIFQKSCSIKYAYIQNKLIVTKQNFKIFKIRKGLTQKTNGRQPS